MSLTVQVKSWKIYKGLRWWNIWCILTNGQEINIPSFPSIDSATKFASNEGFPKSLQLPTTTVYYQKP